MRTKNDDTVVEYRLAIVAPQSLALSMADVEFLNEVEERKGRVRWNPLHMLHGSMMDVVRHLWSTF